jgi:hypothetical protein
MMLISFKIVDAILNYLDVFIRFELYYQNRSYSEYMTIPRRGVSLNIKNRER